MPSSGSHGHSFGPRFAVDCPSHITSTANWIKGPIVPLLSFRHLRGSAQTHDLPPHKRVNPHTARALVEEYVSSYPLVSSEHIHIQYNDHKYQSAQTARLNAQGNVQRGDINNRGDVWWLPPPQWDVKTLPGHNGGEGEASPFNRHSTVVPLPPLTEIGVMRNDLPHTASLVKHAGNAGMKDQLMAFDKMLKASAVEIEGLPREGSHTHTPRSTKAAKGFSSKIFRDYKQVAGIPHKTFSGIGARVPRVASIARGGRWTVAEAVVQAAMGDIPEDGSDVSSVEEIEDLAMMSTRRASRLPISLSATALPSSSAGLASAREKQERNKKRLRKLRSTMAAAVRLNMGPVGQDPWVTEMNRAVEAYAERLKLEQHTRTLTESVWENRLLPSEVQVQLLHPLNQIKEASDLPRELLAECYMHNIEVGTQVEAFTDANNNGNARDDKGRTGASNNNKSTAPQTRHPTKPTHGSAASPSFSRRAPSTAGSGFLQQSARSLQTSSRSRLTSKVLSDETSSTVETVYEDDDDSQAGMTFGDALLFAPPIPATTSTLEELTDAQLQARQEARKAQEEIDRLNAENEDLAQQAGGSLSRTSSVSSSEDVLPWNVQIKKYFVTTHELNDNEWRKRQTVLMEREWNTATQHTNNPTEFSAGYRANGVGYSARYGPYNTAAQE